MVYGIYLNTILYHHLVVTCWRWYFHTIVNTFFFYIYNICFMVFVFFFIFRFCLLVIRSVISVFFFSKWHCFLEKQNANIIRFFFSIQYTGSQEIGQIALCLALCAWPSRACTCLIPHLNTDMQPDPSGIVMSWSWAMTHGPPAQACLLCCSWASRPLYYSKIKVLQKCNKKKSFFFSQIIVMQMEIY